jgi:hypothetical protein
MERFFTSRTDDELATYERDGKLPQPIPNRPSPLDRLDRKALVKLWETNERIFRGRSHHELDYYTTNGIWPEQKGQFHYSMQDGKLCIEWRNKSEEEGAGLAGRLTDSGGPGGNVRENEISKETQIRGVGSNLPDVRPPAKPTD